MNKKKVRDISKVAKRQAYYSTLARKEAKSATQRAKREKKAHLNESAKDSYEEAEIAQFFAGLRKLKSNKEKEKLKKK